jgi:hypothetical protein
MNKKKSGMTNISYFVFRLKVGAHALNQTYYPYKYGFSLVPVAVFAAVFLALTFLPWYVFVELLEIKFVELILPFLAIVGIFLGLVAMFLTSYYLYIDNEL